VVGEDEEEVIMALRNGSYDGGFVAVGDEVEVEEEEAAAAMVVTTRVGLRCNLDGEQVRPLKLCIIGAGGFIGSHLCEKLMWDTHHSVLAVDVYGDKIQHLLAPGKSWSDRIEFYKINIKHDSRLEGLIKLSDLVINLAAICTPADYNTRPLDTIYSNFSDALPVVQYCRVNHKRLIHFSTCEVYGKTIGSFLPADSPLKKVPKKKQSPNKLVL
jgi:UDP-apiose/xylose synthase